MSILARIEKWNPDLHGFSNSEQAYLKYMQTKYLLMKKIDNNIINNNAKLLMDIKYAPSEYKNVTEIAIVKKIYLKFRGRHFAIINNGLQKFQTLWKKYYSTHISQCLEIANKLSFPTEINHHIHSFTTQQYL